MCFFKKKKSCVCVCVKGIVFMLVMCKEAKHAEKTCYSGNHAGGRNFVLFFIKCLKRIKSAPKLYILLFMLWWMCADNQSFCAAINQWNKKKKNKAVDSSWCWNSQPACCTVEKRHLLKLYFSDGRSGIIHAANNTLGKPNYLPLLTTLRYLEITFLPPMEATKTWMWTSCSAALNATSRRNISQADVCFKEFLEDIFLLI